MEFSLGGDRQRARDLISWSAMKQYRPWAPEQAYLLPPSPLDWLPEGHLAYFVLELVRELELTAIESSVQSGDSRGTRPYAPKMMTALLVYAYCVGIFSSRRIERATYEDVAFRVLSGGEHPHFTTVNEFRLVHRKALASSVSPPRSRRCCFAQTKSMSRKTRAGAAVVNAPSPPLPASISACFTQPRRDVSVR